MNPNGTHPKKETVGKPAALEITTALATTAQEPICLVSILPHNLTSRISPICSFWDSVTIISKCNARRKVEFLQQRGVFPQNQATITFPPSHRIKTQHISHQVSKISIHLYTPEESGHNFLPF